MLVFADTLFVMDKAPDLDADAVVWVMEVEDPSRFGVVVKDGDRITDFVEKPDTPISNEAIVGIYYVKEGQRLGREIQYLMDHEVTGKGDEYQLTDALDRMLKDGATFKTARVTEWLDCGTIPAIKETCQHRARQAGREPEGGDRREQPGHRAGVHRRGRRRQATRSSGRTRPSTAARPSPSRPSGTPSCSATPPSRAPRWTARWWGTRPTSVAFAGTLNIGDHATVGPER